MGMRGGLFPAQTQAHLIQQAQMARMQAQRHQHTQVYIGLAPGKNGQIFPKTYFLNFEWAYSMNSSFRNIEFHHVVKQ